MDDDNSGSAKSLNEITNPDTEYERSDLPPGVIALAALGLAILLGASPVILLYAFPGIGTDVARNLRELPPEPRLQTDPRSDLQAQLSRQRARLDSYAWVDRTHAIARVPVSVAMKHLAEQGIEGFPAQPSQAERP